MESERELMRWLDRVRGVTHPPPSSVYSRAPPCLLPLCSLSLVEYCIVFRTFLPYCCFRENRFFLSLRFFATCCWDD